MTAVRQVHHVLRPAGGSKQRVVYSITSGFQRYVSVHPLNTIEFYCFVPVATRLEALPPRKRGKLAGQPTGPVGLLTVRHAHSPYTAPKRQRHYGNGATVWRYGHGFLPGSLPGVISTDCDQAHRRRRFILSTGAQLKKLYQSNV